MRGLRTLASPFSAVRAAAIGVVTLVAVAIGGTASTAGTPAAKTSIAVLGVNLSNVKEDLEPTTDEEKARLPKVEELFRSRLDGSGRYSVVPLPDEMRAKIAAGQAIGLCGGCEIDFGKSLGAELVTWVEVEKVSNLILLMNVYVSDVSTGKVTFFKSVSMRSNTDESWLRSIDYVLKNYLLVESAEPPPSPIKPQGASPGIPSDNQG